MELKETVISIRQALRGSHLSYDSLERVIERNTINLVASYYFNGMIKL